MDKTIKPEDIIDQISLWFSKSVMTPDTAIQLAIIILAFAAGSLLAKHVRVLLTDKINALKIPFRFTEILHSLLRLVLPGIALLIISIGGHFIALEPLDFSNNICTVFSKLLLAWIFIRLLVQFVSNRFARNLLSVTIWGFAALSIFGILNETTAVLDSFGMDLGKFRLSALTVIKGIIAITVLLYGAGFISSFLERKISKAGSLTPSSRVLINKMIRVSLIITALFIGIAMSGVDLSLLAVFSGALGLGLGFGLQRVFSNVFSGFMLLMDQSIKPGDIIEAFAPDGKASTFGWVQFMGTRFTEIVTRDNKSYLIPNEQLVTNQVINWSHGDTLVRMEVFFKVGFDVDPHMVRKLTAEAAAKPPRVVASPAPLTHIEEFSDYGIKYVLRFWIRDAEKGVTNIKGEVLLAIWDALKEQGIPLPYPYQEVTVRKA